METHMHRVSLLGCALALLAACANGGAGAAALEAGHYELSLESHAKMPEGAAPFDVKLRAGLELRVSATPEWLVAQLVEPRFEAGAEQAGDFAKLADEIGKPFALHVEAGRVTEHRFAAGLSGFAVAMLRSITAPLQLPGANAELVREWDSTGEYEARYTPAVQGLRKQKLRYVRLLGSAPKAEQSLPVVHSSRVDLVLASGRVQRVDSRELVSSPLLQGTTIEVDNRVLLTFRAELPGNTPLAALAGNVMRVDQPYFDAVPRAAFDAARVEGSTVAELITKLERSELPAEGNFGTVNGQAIDAQHQKESEASMASRFAVFSALVAKLRMDEQAVEAVLGAIRQDSPAARQLMAALVNADRSSGLIGFARDTTLPLPRRRSVVGALLRSEHPSEAACELLLSLLGDEAFVEHSRYGLGTFARHLREQGEVARAEQLVQPLLTELASTQDERRRLTLLRGLANAGSHAALTAVRGDLVSDSAVLREAAIYALALVPGPEVDAVYSQRLGIEPENAILELILSSVAQHRPPSAELVRAMQGVLQDQARSAHWQSTLKALSVWQAEVPAARELLQRIARSHQDASLRAAAQATVSEPKEPA
jgi:hypothetical protein